MNSFQHDATAKTSLSSFSRETLADDIDLPHGTIDGRTASATDIVGTIDDSVPLPVAINDKDKQRMFDKTYSAQENTAASIEEVRRVARRLHLVIGLLPLDRQQNRPG